MSLPPAINTRMPRRMPYSLGFKRYALAFDGVDDYVEVPYSQSLDVDVVSIEAIFAPEPTPTDAYELVVKPSSYTLYAYTSETRDRPEWNFGVVTGGTFYGTLGGVVTGVNPSEFYRFAHVVGVFDGSELRVYVNGQLYAYRAVSGVIDKNTNNIKINNRAEHKGKLALVRIYNRPLTESEIRYNMLNYHNPVRDGLVLWLADRIVGNTWYDESSQGNHGTIHGAQVVKVKQYELRAEVGL